jgi:hypothetical protein
MSLYYDRMIRVNETEISGIGIINRRVPAGSVPLQTGQLVKR